MLAAAAATSTGHLLRNEAPAPTPKDPWFPNRTEGLPPTGGAAPNGSLLLSGDRDPLVLVAARRSLRGEKTRLRKAGSRGVQMCLYPHFLPQLELAQQEKLSPRPPLLGLWCRGGTARKWRGGPARNGPPLEVWLAPAPENHCVRLFQILIH